jgi:hypothetical protein
MRRVRRKKAKLTLRVVIDGKLTSIQYPMPKKLKIVRRKWKKDAVGGSKEATALNEGMNSVQEEK